MLYKKSDSRLYVQEFKKRFSNFCDKAPLLISFTTTPAGVQVVDETTDVIFDIEFDYSIPVKSLIHGIKQMLVDRGCYPLLRQVTTELEPVPEKEQLQMIESGMNIESVPTTRERKKVTEYLIDKVIIFKDQFVIKELKTGRLFLYQMGKSSSFFLQKIRLGKLNEETSAVYFFTHSTLDHEVGVKQDITEAE